MMRSCGLNKLQIEMLKSLLMRSSVPSYLYKKVVLFQIPRSEMLVFFCEWDWCGVTTMYRWVKMHSKAQTLRTNDR